MLAFMMGSVLRALGIGSSMAWGLCGAACAAPPQAPVASAGVSAKAQPSLASSAGLTYHLSEGAKGVLLDDRGTRGVLLDNRRFTISSTGQVTLAGMQAPDLMPALPLPARLGGGFLFWNGDAAYRARSFDADLEPIAPLPTNAVGFAFGPDSVLIIGEENWRRQYTLSGKRIPLSPPNVIDFVASDDGRSLAIDAAGRVLASTDRGQTWKGVPRAQSAPLRALHGAANDVWLEFANGGQSSLNSSGELHERPAEPSARRAPSRSPLGVDFERIASFGSQLDGGRALVVTGNRFSIVDIRSGRARNEPQLVAESGLQCEALATQQRWLFACTDEAGQVRVLSGAPEQSPSLEKAFPTGAALWFSGGALLVEAACSGAHDPGRVCVRSSDGRYAEYDVTKTFTKSGVPEPRVAHWVPGGRGAPVALLGHLNPDGSVAYSVRVGLGNASSIPLTMNLPALFQEPHLEISTEASSHRYTKRVQTSFTQLADGSLRGFSKFGALLIGPSGHVALDSRRFSALGQHAGRAFARTADGHFFQTADFGEHWLEVAGPATDSSAAFSYDCSDMGCFLGHWSRIGWPDEPPLAKTSERPIPAPLPEAAPALGLDLSCEPLGNPVLEVHPAPQQAGQAYLDASNGPGTVRGLSGAARAMLDAALPGNRAQSAKAISISFSEVFEPSGASRRAALPSAQWLAAWKKQADNVPSRGGARPIFGASLGHSAGVLLDDEQNFAFSAGIDGWLRPLPAAGPCEFCSGYLDSKGKLWLAVSKPSGATALFAAEAGKVVFRAPPVFFTPERNAEQAPERQFLQPVLGFANSDLIAVDPKGTLALVRLPSGADPPGGDAPALLLSADAEPFALAPWSTLELATSPNCTRDRAGYRALLQTPFPWLTALGYTPHNGSVSAIVRWSNTRVCLEAVELPVSLAALHQGPISQPDGAEPTLVARFVGKSPGVAAISRTLTREYRQALSCSLR